jgi:hypothetical protein
MQLLIAVGVVIWAIALVSLCGRRDIEIHRKVTWIVIVLVLNALGAVLYFAFGPRQQGLPGSDADRIDPDAEPVNPEGSSWNPILGENRLPAGEGLNPKDETAPQDVPVQPSRD